MQYIKCGSHIFTVADSTPQTKQPLSEKQQKIQKKALETLFSHKTCKSTTEDRTESAILTTFKKNNKTTYQLTNYDGENHEISTIELVKKADKKLIDLLLQEVGEKRELRLTRNHNAEKVDRMIREHKNFGTLYLWSSGGGGHRSAKDAKLEEEALALKQEIYSRLSDDPDMAKEKCEFLQETHKFIDWCKQMGHIQEADVLVKYLKVVGKKSVDQWDSAQRSGNVSKQEHLAMLQPVSDVVFAFPVFFGVLKDLCKSRPQKVVCTEAMAIGSILLAIKVYNMFFNHSKEPVKLHLYLTDMPTSLSEHFFGPMRKLFSFLGKKNLILYTAPPNDPAIDLTKLCNLKQANIRYLKIEELPVRPAFIEAASHYDKEKPLQLKLSCEEELQLLQGVLKHQKAKFSPAATETTGAQDISWPIDENDEAYFLMLGSQPTSDSIIAYVDEFVRKARDNPSQQYKLFAFAGKFSDDCFYKTLCQHITQITPWPLNLLVTPLSFQDPAHLVSLELKCHTITRSGGLTIMELLVLEETNKNAKNPRKRFIHAESVKESMPLHLMPLEYVPKQLKIKPIKTYENSIPLRTLAESIPLWERGNYFYLKQSLENHHNVCRVINPSILFSDPEVDTSNSI